MDNRVKLFVEFLSRVQGPSTELILYNCKTNDREILYNGAVTGKNLGDLDYTEELEKLKNQATEVGDFSVGYRGKSLNEQPLRVSNLFLRDANGDLEYVLCVNQNITELERFQDFLSFFINANPIDNRKADAHQDNVEVLMTTLIQNEVEYMKLSGMDITTKEARYDILKKIYDKGIFDIKGSVPKVCEVLNISQATLYNYLKDINK